MAEANGGDGVRMSDIGFEGIDSNPQERNLYPNLPPGDNGHTGGEGQGSGDTDNETLVKGSTAIDMPTPDRDTLFFRDEEKRIDYVLAYRKDKDETSKKGVERENKRQRFEKNLMEEGVVMEREDKDLSQDGATYFIKLHASWEVLTRYAELMNLKMPLKEWNNVLEQVIPCYSCYNIFSKIPNPFAVNRDLIPEEEDYFTAAFKRDRIDEFQYEDSEAGRKAFFHPDQRSRIIHEILTRTRYDDEQEGHRPKFGIKKLLANGSYEAAFPLHDGPATSENSVLTEGIKNDRHLLYEEWANWKKFYKFQPIDAIRRYFGEKVGIYFTWLGFYTTMLIPASVVGLLVFFYGISVITTDDTVARICDGKEGSFVMCPLCDEGCDCYHLNTSCLYSRASVMFDNGGTVFFAIFMSLWATFFMEFWKRKNAELQYEWDVSDFEEEEQVIRPEYERGVTGTRVNPVTNVKEPWLNGLSKFLRLFSSFAVIIFMICLVLAAVFGVIIYRIVIVGLIYQGFNNDAVKSNAKLVTTATAAIISLLVIVLLNKFYERIAQFLTDLEMPRTDTEWEDSFTFKMFLFQCVNYYSTIFYVAFFKGRFNGSPGNYAEVFGGRGEECDPAGCLIELAIQLAIVMVGKQAINNVKEVIVPLLMARLCRKKKEETEENKYTSWERDFDLANIPVHGLFEEYLEMVVQFGFVTLFVAAFPLAPFFALLNNIIEIRIDASKYVRVWKRPMAARAQDIGVWYWILNALAKTAVLTNGLIIAITSDFVNKRVYDATVLFTNVNSTSYIDWSLSSFESAKFNRTDTKLCLTEKYCRYRDFRDSVKSDYTLDWWHILAAKLAFVLLFEHFVFGVTWLVAFIIPDVPTTVKYEMLREKHLAKEALFRAESTKSKKEKKLE